ncbi:MAG: MBL fold metallo-hydrolase [Halanaeroarchaeum sp.]
MTTGAASIDDGTAIDPRALYERIEAGESVTILDVRGPEEFAEWYIDGDAVEVENVPGTVFEGGLDEDLLDSLPRDDPLIVVCAKGRSSAEIAGMLRERGIDAKNLANGMEGWARITVAREITRYDGAGRLYQYERPSSGCLAYLLVDGAEAAVFDPLLAFADRYRSDAEAEGATLAYAVDTHVHADHVSGVRALAERGATGVLSERAAERGVTFADEVETIADGETLRVGAATVEAIATPGHTTGMTSFLIDDEVLLTGDGLFSESLARPDLEAGADGAEAAARRLHESIHERILTRSDDTVIAGGHVSETAEPAADGTYTATVGELRESMPILSVDAAEFAAEVLADMPPRPANYRTIIAINLGEESVSEDLAFSLELGPNNCATSTEALRGV